MTRPLPKESGLFVGVKLWVLKIFLFLKKKPMSSSRGIYLVANKRSEQFCENLIYTIRQFGCSLPIKVIHFGGEPVTSSYIIGEAQLVTAKDFSPEANQFVEQVAKQISDCPRGFLYRFLAWFGEWEEFIYSDNDIVALCDWTELFEHLQGHDLVHADQEYITEGIYNFVKPKRVTELFGAEALEQAITAGHFAARRSQKQVDDIIKALDWFEQNPSIPKKHDQTLMHIAILLGKWKVLNLCKPPYNWASSWAGDHPNSFEVIKLIQTGQKISHIHYSGGTPDGTRPIDDLMFASSSAEQRLKQIVTEGMSKLSGYKELKRKKGRIITKLKNIYK